MKVIDCVKPAPQDEIEAWERKMHAMFANLWAGTNFRKTIKVKYVP